MTEFDSYSDDGVSAVINLHTEAHLFSLPNDCLWYDKLWGPSQRVVTLFPSIPKLMSSLWNQKVDN